MLMLDHKFNLNGWIILHTSRKKYTRIHFYWGNFQVSTECLQTAYCGLIHSVIVFCIIAWTHFPYTALVFKLQPKTIHSVTRKIPEMSSSDTILTLQSIFMLLCLVHVKQNSSWYAVHPLADASTWNSQPKKFKHRDDEIRLKQEMEQIITLTI